MTEHELRELLAEYLTLLQRHPPAEEMMEKILTEDFETGFEGGFSWKGIDGLRDSLSHQRRVHRLLLPPLASAARARPLARGGADSGALRRSQRQRRATVRNAR